MIPSAIEKYIYIASLRVTKITDTEIITQTSKSGYVHHISKALVPNISYFAKFCNCGGWQVKALPCEPMSWRSMRADGADEVWRQSTGEFPLAQGGQSFCYIRAFN